MLFNFPTFLGTKEQTSSERLYNQIKILIQTHLQEILIDLDYGTNIRNYIKQGINSIVISDIRDELTDKIMQYFSNDVIIDHINISQDSDILYIDLEYLELRTGLHNTIETQETLIENPQL